MVRMMVRMTETIDNLLLQASQEFENQLVKFSPALIAGSANTRFSSLKSASKVEKV